MVLYRITAEVAVKVGGHVVIDSMDSLETIAEGVEKSSQLNFLRNHGCNEAQGFYFSKPLPAEEFEAFASNYAG
tara:strand:- start:1642 stop:1863 length:222 start_codon:yes stop_codon:yes gene_type:complete